MLMESARNIYLDIRTNNSKNHLPELIKHYSCLDDDDDFVNKRISLKPKENGASAISCPGSMTVKKEDVKPRVKPKPLSPVKLTPTSALDYFGTSSVQRSEKKLVASKRKEVSTDEVPSGYLCV